MLQSVGTQTLVSLTTTQPEPDLFDKEDLFFNTKEEPSSETRSI